MLGLLARVVGILAVASAVAPDTLRVVNPLGKLAVYTIADGAYQQKVEAALAIKQCYCLVHGCEFVLDVYKPRHDRTIHWSKLSGIHRLLPYYDWILYLDADLFIIDSAFSISNVLTRAAELYEDAQRRWSVFSNNSTPLFMVLQDGMEVNSGGFLVRGRQYAKYTDAFLTRWWLLEKATKAWAVFEQGALGAALLEYSMLYTGFRGRNRFDPNVHCLDALSYWQFWACYHTWMAKMGLPFGRRSIGGIVMLPGPFEFGPENVTAADEYEHTYDRLHALMRQTVLGHHMVQSAEGDVTYSGKRKWQQVLYPRGFNLLSTLNNSGSAWFHHPSHQFAMHDFTAHVTSHPRFAELYAQFTNAAGDKYIRTCPPFEYWEFLPVCHGPPCADEIWDTSQHQNGLQPVFKFPNRWRGYVHEGPAFCVPYAEFVEVPTGGRMLPSTYTAPDVCYPRWHGINVSVDGQAAIDAGPYQSPGFREMYNDSYAGRKLLPCSPAYHAHIFMRLIVNVTRYPEIAWFEAPNSTRRAYAYVAADFAMAPWEHLPSRLFDFIGQLISDELLYAPLLQVVIRNPDVIHCRAGLRNQVLHGPRWYVNETNHFHSVVLKRETLTGLRIAVLQ